MAGNRKWRVSLDKTAERRGFGNKLSFVSLQIKSGICPSIIPASLLEKYCRRDVELTVAIFKQQIEELQELNLLPVQYTRCIVTPALADIESRGMKLDTNKVLEANLEYEKKYNNTSAEISEFAGDTNLNSPQQVAELLYDRLGFSELKDRRGNPIRTAKNGRCTGTEVVTSLKANNKHQRRFIRLYKERSKLDSALSKNLRFFRAVVEETEDGIFYANLNQTVTATHRLSSTGKPKAFALFDNKPKGVQFQNIPRDFKPLFIPRNKGWVIGEIDGAQLEFRVAAFLGQDTRAMRDIAEGVDVHTFTADTLSAAGEQTSRQDAKSRTFKPLYGGLSGTKAERTYFEEFKRKYSGITDTQEGWKSEVERTKQLVTATGLIFYWPDTRWEGSAKKPYLKNTTSICNFPVQSFATADIIPIAVRIMWEEINKRGLKSFIINTIHDSVIMEIHPDEIEIIKEIGELSFIDGVKEYLMEVYKIDFNVELGIEMKWGQSWNGDDCQKWETSK